ALGVGCTAGGFRVSRDLSSAIYKVWVFVGFTAEDFMQKEHWANVKNTIMECLALGVVPIINENDSTNTAELRFGDN
ncbi:proB, partial [Symbiodinium sp. KB8]